MVTANVEINIAILFKGVDVMENKERISGEDTNLVVILSVDDVKSSGLVWFPVEPFCRTCWEDSVSESWVDVNT